MPTVYFAITNHGFGHTTRTCSVIAELQAQCPEITIIIATTAPRWLLESYLSQDFIHHQRSFDVGVIQSDSLNMDKVATLDKLNFLRSNQSEIIAREVEFLHSHQVDLIVADIPPLVAAIAEAANIPCWMSGNFGWDFIYQDWVDKGEREFAEITNWISQLHGKSDRLLRLPFHEPMSDFGTVQDIGLTGGTPKYTAEELCDRFSMCSIRPKALLTFGGLSLNAIPYQNLAKFPDWQFITFDRDAPELPNLTQICGHTLRPVDLMPICDRIISKPGYSTLSEACRLGVPVVCLTRDGFSEAEILIGGLQDYNHHLIISPEDFYEGDWQFLTTDMRSPRRPDTLPNKRGEVEIATTIQKYLSSHAKIT
jgi:hypothetical protein